MMQRVAAGFVALLLGAVPVLATAQPEAEPRPRRMGLARAFESPTTQPAPAEGAFDASFFDYSREGLEVAWATPSTAQTLVFGRPPAMKLPEAPADGLPEPVRMVGTEIRWLAFRGGGDDWVPALLVTPEGREGPFPLVVATHGLLSQKMQVVSQVGPSLIRRGYAVLAIDLPKHGEREGSGLELLDRRDPRRMFDLWRQAVVDIRRAMDAAATIDLIDNDKPVTLVGYSLGSWMSAIVGAADERVDALVLMVGGATELAAEMLALPFIAASDPRSAVAAFAPRPLLMVNALNDRTVTPAMARRLFEAAREPKEIRWYDMGHILRDPAYEEAAEWIMTQRERAAAGAR